MKLDKFLRNIIVAMIFSINSKIVMLKVNYNLSVSILIRIITNII